MGQGGGGLRVALFSGNYNCVADGANQALNRLVRHLLEVEGAAVRVYSPVIRTPAFPPAGDLVGVRSVAFPGRPEYRLSLGLPDAARADLRRFGPNVVHLSAPDPLGAQAQRFARALGLPVVTSLHTRFESYLDHYRLGFLKGWLTRYLRRFYANSDLVLVPNSPAAADLQRNVTTRVRVWGRGVDRTVFHPGARSSGFRLRHGIGREEAVILFFGRLVREKGLDVFAGAFDALVASGRPVRALVVGEGPARAEIAQRLPDAVFTGHLSGPALGTAVASADILYNPSLTEAFGNVTLEAMAAGRAIVCPDVGSARALIEDGVSGLLVPAGDEAAAVAALARLVDDPNLRCRLGHAAAQVSEGFTWAAASEGVVDAYRDAITLRRAA